VADELRRAFLFDFLRMARIDEATAELEAEEEPREPFLPLRWESTGDQWWYATPIDWAAASGHYDVVRELLRLNANLLVKLTSLRRIHRLESV
jgi:hypothetical protein